VLGFPYCQPLKGTSFPYVVHPIRVAEILDRFGYGEEVVMAGMLHDTIEDASVSHAELAHEFGGRVSELVDACAQILQSSRDALQHSCRRGPGRLTVRPSHFTSSSPSAPVSH